MRISEYIANQVRELPQGQVFSYSDFMKRPEQKEAIIKALNRMVESGKLEKLSKGKYYKAEETVFGNLEPDQYQIVKDLLESNGKITGYLTGYSIYNKLGLTSQISNIIQIGKNDIRPQFKRGRYTISFIKQKNEISKENIPLLQILDAIRYIKKIPDASLISSYERLYRIFKEQDQGSRAKAVKLLLKYPASTRVIAGTMLEMTGDLKLAKTLQKTLNPVTSYKLPGLSKLIPNAETWNIK